MASAIAGRPTGSWPRCWPRPATGWSTPVPRAGTVSSAEGVVAGAPRRWLRLEGLVLLAGALIAFGALGQPWWLVPAAILAPRHRHDRLPGRNPSRRAPVQPHPRHARAGRHARRRLLASRPPSHGPGPGLARPHRPGPAPRHGPEVQRLLHPHPPRRPSRRQVARPRPLDGSPLIAAPNGEYCVQPLV